MAAAALAAALWLGCAPDLGVAPRPGIGGAGGSGAGSGGSGGAGSGGGTGAGPQGLPEWSQVFGGEGDQAGIAVAAEPTGGAVVVGQLGGVADFGGETLESAGGDDIFIAWVDPGGEVTRRLRLGDANPQEARAVAVASDGSVLLAGAMSGAVDFGGDTWTSAGGRDGYVAKLAPDGSPAWGLRFGDAGYQAAAGVAVDPAGQVLLAGAFSGSVTLGDTVTSAGGHDALIAKLGADGTPLWSRSLGGPLDQRAHGVAVDAAGEAVVVGEFAGTVGIGGSTVGSAGASDAFVLKLDDAGELRWLRRFGGSGAETARRVAADGAGGVVIGGEFSNSLNLGGGPLAGSGGGGLFVGKFDGSGGHVWSKGLPGSGGSRLEGLAVSADGGVAITGSLVGTLEIGGVELVSDGDADVFAARLDAEGRLLWARRFGGAGAQEGLGVAITGAGEVVITGRFAGSVEVGGETLESAGGAEALVVKVSR